MKDIENIIKQNRENFDSEEPNEDHINRFQQKLQTHHDKSRWQWKELMKIAAIIAIVMTASFASYQFRDIRTPQFSFGELSPEYQEVENYFKINIDKQLSIISQLTKTTDNHDKSSINKELESMDEMYNQLEKELQTNPNDERIIQAIIEYFQVKNDILNRIVQQLYLIKQ
ncbi:hypothetical protein [Ancylomarina sp. 16SWW S1-10-2]|uniref:hypothetical protein n=1 Tax=Ancylomarina sp. 16SWW S1-10-2 TaxID=2499681 RepID=UPI0012AD3AEB|nr:hypothetical protein [Ancylomarina sp. 16SWW S1-10-2]MRT94073.1 hypothetical protein [Ancylomarina sp. 16SWW S1-10-2]